VGSLSDAYKPGDFVLCDQLVDKTNGRTRSFFGRGVVGHVSFADPFCAGMREAISRVITQDGHPLHPGGTYVCMEGPQFSTRAESRLHRDWKAHLIGMTAIPEARLAREAEMCYATIAMVTDWDCWRESEESVSVEVIVGRMRENTQAVRRLIPGVMAALARRGDCSCRHAAQSTIMTDPALIPYEVKRSLTLLYGKYWKG
jgi:5'-methylthioadenosine phosphorylase